MEWYRFPSRGAVPSFHRVSTERTYDRDEVDAILRVASLADRAQPAALIPHGDGLTLAEIQQVAAQAGIDRSAVTRASVTVGLHARLADTHRLHYEHTLGGALDAGALDRIANAIRARMQGVEVRRSRNEFEFEVTKKGGELGRLLVNVRSRDDVTTLSVWSDAPHMSVVELANCALVGVPVAIFPVVAISGGQWPAAGAIAGVAALGAAAGSGAALAWQRWAAARWRSRVLAVVTPIIEQVAELTDRSSGT